MKRKRVAVLFGGRSSEYDVSLETATAFMAHIDRAAFEVVPVWVERGSGAWNIVPGRRASGAGRRVAGDGLSHSRGALPGTASRAAS